MTTMPAASATTTEMGEVAVTLRVTSRWIMKEYKLAVDTVTGVITDATDKAVYFRGTGMVSPSDTCRRCGRAINHPVSKLMGIGPFCAANVGLSVPDLDRDEVDALRVRLASMMAWEGWLPRRWLEVLEGALPEPAEQPQPTRTITAHGGQFELRYPYQPDLVAAVKAIALPGTERQAARWNALNPQDKFWVAPAVCYEAVERLAETYDFEVSEAARALMASTRQAEEMAQAERVEAVAASRAQDAEVEIEGLGGELRPFQRAGVAYALKAQRCFIADEMGLGKTVQALATVQAAHAYPAVIVCPASLKLNWAREAAKWLPGRSISVWNGKAGVADADIIIINYDVLKRHLDALTALEPQAVIFDESHYCKNHKAQRTEAAKTLAQNVPYRLALTGTPVLNRPAELLSQLGIIDRLGDMGGFWQFARRYCQAYQGRWGWDFSGAAHLDELNTKMRATCYIRRNKADVLTELPAKQRAVVPMTIDNRREYERAEAQVVAWLSERAAADEAFRAEVEEAARHEWPGADEEAQQGRARFVREAIARRAESAAERAARAEQLVKIETLKRLSAQGKLEAVKEWVGSFVESGEKLVLFAHHTEIVEALAETFGAPSITGQTPVEARQAAVDRFQTDPDCKVIVLNIRAGGVGLTLTAASNVAFVELDWTPGAMDQAEDRCHRIGQTDQVTAWYLLGEETIDEDIHDLIETKRAVVEAATEGDVKTQHDTGIVNELLARLTKK